MKRIISLFLAVYLLLTCSAFILSASAVDANEQTKLYNFYQNNMLFGQNKTAVVSGMGKAGDKVSLNLLDSNGQLVAESAGDVGEDGTFELKFTAPKGSYNEYTIAVYCNGALISCLNGVVFGELWLASGQSNMEWFLQNTSDWANISASNNYGSEWVRIFTIPTSVSVLNDGYVPYDPQNDIKECYWIKGGEYSVANVSAISYYFANKLSKELDMPVGVLSVPLGGTPINTWISRDSIEGSKDAIKILKKHSSYISKKDWNKSERSFYKDMTGNYNAKVYPLRNFAISGMLWYQGENDLLTNYTYGQYSLLFDLLQKDYSKLFGFENDLPIIYSQLACYGYLTKDKHLQLFNAEFADMQKSKPDSRALTAISDISLDFIPHFSAIHPITKEPVADRMCQSAMGLVYGESDVYTVASMKSYNVDGKYVYMTFNNVGDGLVCDGTDLKDFAVCGRNGVYYKANAEIVSKDTVRVWNDTIEKPVSATYAISQGNYRANLYSTKNGEKYMPVAPTVTKRLKNAFYYYDHVWFDCEDQQYFRNSSSDYYSGMFDLWDTENCTYQINPDSAYSGSAGLRINSNQNNFSIYQTYVTNVGEDEVTFKDISRDWSKYKALTFNVRNMGAEDLTLKGLRFVVEDGISYNAELNGTLSDEMVIPADGQWHAVEADLDNLFLYGDEKSLGLGGFAIKDVYSVNLDFEGNENSVVDVDSFELSNSENHKTGFYWDFLIRLFKTIFSLIKTLFTVIF